MKYTEVLEQIKQASQDKQAGIFGDLGSLLSLLRKPVATTLHKVDMGNLPKNPAKRLVKATTQATAQAKPKITTRAKPPLIKGNIGQLHRRIVGQARTINEQADTIDELRAQAAGHGRQLKAMADVASEQKARGDKWRSRTWKAGLGGTAVMGGAYALGRINGREGTPQQQPTVQTPAPGTYEAWLNSRRARR